jgi:hypothetical protein
MADAFAKVKDLEARWRTLSPAEKERAKTLLDDVTTYLIARLDYSGVKLDPANELQASLLNMVTCDVVKRVMQIPVNKPAVTSSQQGAGPYQETLSFANPSGDKYLTSDEMRLLGIVKRRQRIGSISLDIRRGERCAN